MPINGFIDIKKPNIELMKKCFDNDTYLEQYNQPGFPNLERLDTWADFLVCRSKKDEVDLDVSPVAMWTYCMMYGWDTNSISKQRETKDREAKYKYQVEHNGHTYRGDTMTSAWTVWRRYMEQKFDKTVPSELKNIIYFTSSGVFCTPPKSDAKSFKDYFDKEIVSKPDFCKSFLKVADDYMSEDAKKFFKLYWSVGNFLLVPLGFNNGRSDFGEKDTADYMLWVIYRYFESVKSTWMNFENPLVGLLSCQSIRNCELWFSDFIDPWKNFLETHLLQDFVEDFDDNKLCPISYKLSTRDKKVPINIIAKNGKYFPLPHTSEEFENFFATANSCIKKRGQRIRDKIKI